VVATNTISKPENTTNTANSGDTLSSGGEYSGICPGLLEAGPISPASRFRYNPVDLVGLCDRTRCLIRTCIPILCIFTGNYFILMKVVHRVHSLGSKWYTPNVHGAASLGTNSVTDPN
jgi:hypothetical protein